MDPGTAADLGRAMSRELGRRSLGTSPSSTPPRRRPQRRPQELTTTHGERLSNILRTSLTATESKLVLNFKDIEVLDQVPTFYTKVHSLMLSQNRIHNLAGLHQFSSLSHVSLSYNCISDFFQLGYLPAKYVQVLSLAGNPVCRHPNYRHFVISLFPRLRSLDQHPVTPSERRDLEDGVKLSAEILPFLCAQKIRMDSRRAILTRSRIQYDLFTKAYGVHSAFHRRQMPSLDPSRRLLHLLSRDRGPLLETTGDETPYIRSRTTPAILLSFLARFHTRALSAEYHQSVPESQDRNNMEHRYGVQLQKYLLSLYKSPTVRQYLKTFADREKFMVHTGDCVYLANLYEFMCDQQREIQDMENTIISILSKMIDSFGTSTSSAPQPCPGSHETPSRRRILTKCFQAWRHRVRSLLDAAEAYRKARLKRKVFDHWNELSSHESSATLPSSASSRRSSMSSRHSAKDASDRLCRHRLLSKCFQAWQNAHLHGRPVLGNIFDVGRDLPAYGTSSRDRDRDQEKRPKSAPGVPPSATTSFGNDSLRFHARSNKRRIDISPERRGPWLPPGPTTQPTSRPRTVIDDQARCDIGDIVAEDGERPFGCQGRWWEHQPRVTSYLDHTTCSLLKTRARRQYVANFLHPLPAAHVLRRRYDLLVARYGLEHDHEGIK